ncbi:MAG: phosphatidate cytidylyltransferase [Alphaproteobacteria bacterium]|nr:phosphatidate cytidylyltransferase [Alphaproteobacteria bacterium]TAD92015.1 MAG: phosphatidate cytidylyltransferase [Alphaproteobacteria bacterium]
MAPSQAEAVAPAPVKRGANLRLRVLSSIVLAPLVLGAIYAGSPWFEAMVTLASGLLAREWGRIADGGRLGRASGALVAAVMGVVTLVGVGGPPSAAILLAVMLTPLLFWWAKQAAGCQAPGWHSAGLLAVALPCLAMDWLRAHPDHGADTIFWIVGVVWATDTGAYIFGRLIGGPKLAPRISPNKTWAGLLGGALAAGLVGLVAGMVLQAPSLAVVALVSAGLAVVAQMGDLGESYLKRHFGVKDSGRLIPGHGGLLDRMDGLLSVTPTVAVLMWATGGHLPLWGA